MGKLGGRKRKELRPDVVDDVRRLTERGFGRDYIAEKLGISARQVRNQRGKLAGTEP